MKNAYVSNYCINEEILKNYNISIEEFLVLLLNIKEVNYQEILKNLVEKDLGNYNIYDNNSLILSNNTKDLITTIIVESDKSVRNKEDKYENLANKMREIFPQGKKPGTSYMWRDSSKIIAKKLKTLVINFGVNLEEEQVIKATKSYVNSFNGDYTYMQLLKYFILKKDIHTGELRSDFLSYLENDDCEENNDWTSKLK